MTDSLRDKIAAVLRSHWPGEFTDTDEDESPIDHLADTVIRELERMKSTRRGRSVAMSELDGVLVDFGLWLSEELRGEPMSRIDLESCLQDWKEGW